MRPKRSWAAVALAFLVSAAVARRACAQTAEYCTVTLVHSQPENLIIGYGGGFSAIAAPGVFGASPVPPDYITSYTERVSAEFSPPGLACIITGQGPCVVSAQETWRFHIFVRTPNGSAAEITKDVSCGDSYSYPYKWDGLPPTLTWQPDPSGLILSSTDQIVVSAHDDVALASVDLGAVPFAPSLLPVTSSWSHPPIPPVTGENSDKYALYQPGFDNESVTLSLQGLSGRVNLFADTQDYAHHTVSSFRTVLVDGQPPTVEFVAPPTVSPAGVVGRVAGTAADDVRVVRVTLAVMDSASGLWWSGSGFTSGGQNDIDLNVTPGTAVDWHYDGLWAAVLPQTGTTWTLIARAYDVTGKHAATQATLVIEPAARTGGTKKSWPNPPPPCNPTPGDFTTDPLSGRGSYYSKILHLPGGSPALDLGLTFTSSGPVNSVWGRGWVNVNDQSLLLTRNGAVLWSDGAGAQANFFPPASGDVYASPLQLFSTMTVTARDLNGKPSQFTLRDKGGTTTTFDVQAGSPTFLPSQLVDRNGNAVTWTRDALTGNVQQVTDSHGRFLKFTYTNGRVSASDDSAGRHVSYTYDADGFKLSETGPDGTTAFAYDKPNMRLLTVTYPNGGTRAVQYDAQGRVLSETSGAGGDGQNTYQYFASSTVVTDAGGRATVYAYMTKDGLRRPTTVTDALGKTVALGYDARLNATSQVDAREGTRATTYGYDGNGNLTDVFAPLSAHTHTVFDQVFNQPTAVTDPNGNATTLGYNAANGDLTSVASVVAGRTLTTTLGNDGLGHVASITDPRGMTTLFSYDKNGQLSSVTDPLARQTTLTRDAAGRVTQQSAPARTAGSLDVTSFSYDPVSEDLTDVKDPLNGVTHYDYAPGRGTRLLAKVTDARQMAANSGLGTVFGYDAGGLGRLTSVTPPAGGAKRFTYNKDGTIVTATNGRNVTTTYGYDAKGRLTSRTNVDGTYSFGYDGADRQTSLSAPSGASEARVYDDLDRLKQSVQTIPGAGSFTISYSYDANGNRTSMTTPWGTFSYTPDELNRVRKVVDPQNAGFQFVYDDGGRRTRIIRSVGPAGINTDYAYDDAGQLLGSTTTLVTTGVVIASASYVYDNAGNRTSRTDVFGTDSYVYDGLNRLTAAAHPAASPLDWNHTETFAYDQVGNRTSDDSIASYSYDAANRITANSSYTFTSDADGNVTGRTDLAGNAATLGYDNQNELTGVGLPLGMGSVSFAYDASGRRVTKTVTGPSGTRTLHYVYDNEKLLAVVDQAGGLIAMLTNGPGIDEPLKMHEQATGQDLLYYADGLGSVIALSDLSGNVLERVTYSAYGVPTFVDLRGASPVASAGSWTDNPHAFTGQVCDAETRLCDYKARYYSPDLGAFVSKDPFTTGPSALRSDYRSHANPYLYGLANPIDQTDPSGTIAVGAEVPPVTLSPGELETVNQNIIVSGLLSAASNSLFPQRPIFGPNSPDAYAAFGLIHMNFGPLDYKRLGGTDYLGNFNFGADAQAFGLTLHEALAIASFAHRFPGSAGGGLNPNQEAAIVSGWHYAHARSQLPACP